MYKSNLDQYYSYQFSNKAYSEYPPYPSYITMESLSNSSPDDINTANMTNIKKQITKTSFNEEIPELITDYDHFPYTRWFRGVAESDRPIVAERVAGWRPRNDKCYKPTTCPEVLKPRLCFQVPCSTQMPCRSGVDINTGKYQVNQVEFTLNSYR